MQDVDFLHVSVAQHDLLYIKQFLNQSIKLLVCNKQFKLALKYFSMTKEWYKIEKWTGSIYMYITFDKVQFVPKIECLFY